MKGKSKKVSWRIKVSVGGVVLMCLFVLYAFYINEVRGINDMLINTIALENIYYITQIIAALAVFLGTIIAIWQYRRGKQCEYEKYQNEKITRSIELARYYKDNILDKVFFIITVYKKSGLLDLIKKADGYNLEKFDEVEMKKIYSDPELKKIQNIIKSKEFSEIVLSVALEMGLEIGKAEGDTVKAKQLEIIKLFGQEYISEALNNLEYFAMHFVHETADSEVVYQSLHRTYFQIVETLYHNIALNNKVGQPKLYTNVTRLYLEWKDVNKKQLEKMQSSMDESIVFGENAKMTK